MKWTRVETHWQELASKANAEQRNASPKSQPGAELGTRGPELAVDADPPPPRVDVQATDGSGAGTDSPRDTD